MLLFSLTEGRPEVDRKLAGSNVVKGSHCVRKLTEDAIHMDCGCDYGLIHEPTAGYRKCNFTDMVTCANGYVKNYIFGILDDKVESFCPQPCESLDYEIRHIMVSLIRVPRTMIKLFSTVILMSPLWQRQNDDITFQTIIKDCANPYHMSHTLWSI